MITIIMPVYNEGEYIYQNVVSVDDFLTEQAIEHQFLLVDDGSKDQSYRKCAVWRTIGHVFPSSVFPGISEGSRPCARRWKMPEEMRYW